MAVCNVCNVMSITLFTPIKGVQKKIKHTEVKPLISKLKKEHK